MKRRISLSGGFDKVRVMATQKHKKNIKAMLVHIQQLAWDKASH